jgi:hypothetical protein
MTTVRTMLGAEHVASLPTEQRRRHGSLIQKPKLTFRKVRYKQFGNLQSAKR